MSIELARGRGRVIIAAAIVSAAAILVSIATTSPRRADSSDSAHGAAAPAHSAGQAQYFEANRGQADPSVSFLCHSRAYTMFLTRSEAVYRIVRRLGRTADVPGVGIRLRDNSTLQMALVRIALMGASPDVRVEGAQPLAGRVNYLIGDDPAKWHTGVPTYSQVRYRAAYPGIDLVYYGSYPALEYDLVVAPGADPSVIRFAITATGTARIDLQGNVEIATPAGTLTMRRPRIYQESTLGGQDPVDGHFVLRKAGVAYQVGIELGRYDARRPLVIDPQLVYSSFLGGSGEKATGASGDVAKDIVLDSSNHAYIAGGTFSSDFPTTTGPHTDPGEKNGTPVAFVAKFDTTRRGAASLVYSTYLGGSGNTANGVQDGDSATGIAVDGQGHAYVTGFTTSTDFPHTPGAWRQPTTRELPPPSTAS